MNSIDGRRQRWEGHREQRRALLVAAAIEAIREHGPEVGMDAIAGYAGVSKPVLYRYFADKSELWLAVGQQATLRVQPLYGSTAGAAVADDRVVRAALPGPGR